jgi:hypothetical protein
VRALLANTRTAAEPPNRRSANAVPSSVPPSMRPVIGPILLLCYTNHALDSFLMDLLHCGIDSFIRVGRRYDCCSTDSMNYKTLRKQLVWDWLTCCMPTCSGLHFQPAKVVVPVLLPACLARFSPAQLLQQLVGRNSPGVLTCSTCCLRPSLWQVHLLRA